MFFLFGFLIFLLSLRKLFTFLSNYITNMFYNFKIWHSKWKKYYNKIKIIFIICLIIFNVRNIDRINKKLELDQNNNHNFTNFPFYWTKDVNYSRKNINNYEVSFLNGNDPCWDIKPVCVRRPNINIKKNNGYIFYSVNIE